MNKKVKIIICLCFLLFNIFGICTYTKLSQNIEIETKKVWITSDVQKIRDPGRLHTVSYYVKYDDHNGEEGILYTRNLKKGDEVTVYRDKNSISKNDSTHGWKLTKKNAINHEYLGIILFAILTLINLIIFYRILTT